MNYDRTPRARDWAIPMFMACVSFLLFLLDQESQWIVAWLSGVVAFGSWFIVNFLHHVLHIRNDIRNEHSEMDYRLSENFKLEAISKMNDVQIKALRAGYHILDVIPGNHGAIEMLHSEEVYLYLAWFVLVNSTNDTVYPINNFKPGTYHFDMLGDHEVDDYQQARNFHVWLVRYGYCKWGSGNASARWVKPMTPDGILSRLGIDRNTYKQDDENE